MIGWFQVGLAAFCTLPGILLASGVFDASAQLRSLVFGVAIVGAAFLLSWAAEVVQLDFSQGLALALLALIAILPEYVVDATFAWLAAEDPSYAGYAVANMTGANRLLIGVAWPLVVVLAYLRFRQTRLELEESHGLELAVLLAATIYAFIIPLKGTISLLDTVILFAIFGFYIWRIARMPAEAPHLVGPARLIGSLAPTPRRVAAGLLALGATIAVLQVAKPFATALVATGVSLGIDEFLLVQWLAPLASEAPEFVVVSLFAWRGAGAAALGTLVSSKINQWTLLVAMLPLIYGIALGAPHPLPLDGRQRDEILLTATQSLFAVVILLNLRLSLLGAATLFGLFSVQMVFPETRMVVTAAYAILTAVAIARTHRDILKAFRWVRA